MLNKYPDCKLAYVYVSSRASQNITTVAYVWANMQETLGVHKYHSTCTIESKRLQRLFVINGLKHNDSDMRIMRFVSQDNVTGRLWI